MSVIYLMSRTSTIKTFTSARCPAPQPAKGTQMFTKPIAAGYALFTALLTSVALLSQAPPTPSSSFAGLEFPVIMRQKVVAGTTKVGTKVEAKLAVATLVNGVVVPQDAILSGEVIESAA